MFSFVLMMKVRGESRSETEVLIALSDTYLQSDSLDYIAENMERVHASALSGYSSEVSPPCSDPPTTELYKAKWSIRALF